MMANNTVFRISLMGGLIGALTTNPGKALEEKIAQQNQDGWKALQITQHGTTNLFIRVLQLLVFVVTLGLFTWAGGYLDPVRERINEHRYSLLRFEK